MPNSKKAVRTRHFPPLTDANTPLLTAWQMMHQAAGFLSAAVPDSHSQKRRIIDGLTEAANQLAVVAENIQEKPAAVLVPGLGPLPLGGETHG